MHVDNHGHFSVWPILFFLSFFFFCNSVSHWAVCLFFLSFCNKPVVHFVLARPALRANHPHNARNHVFDWQTRHIILDNNND